MVRNDAHQERMVGVLMKRTLGNSLLSRGVAASAVVLLLTVTTATSAYAEEEPAPLGTVDDVASFIEEVAPEAALAETRATADGVVVSDTAGVTTSVPVDASAGVTVDVGDEMKATIELPGELDITEGEVASDGTVVYAAAEDAVAVQTLADGSTRVQTVLSGPTSAHEFGYRMDGFKAAISETGEAVFIGDDGSYVPIAAAWAVDANGVTVETHYTVRGDELVQVVVPTEATVYPVVADPTWVWVGAGWGMKLNRTETSNVRNYAAAVGMCAVFTRSVPGLAIGCSVWGSYVQAQANLAQSDSPRSCLFFNTVPAPGSIWRVGC